MRQGILLVDEAVELVQERPSQATIRQQPEASGARDLCLPVLIEKKQPILAPHLLRVPRYVAGKPAEEISAEMGLDRVLKLNSNENPLGPSPMALAAMQETLADAHRYPGIAERDLRHKLAAYHGHHCSPQHFVIGNGATDILRIVAQAFMCHGGESVMCRTTFPLFALLTTMFGGKVVEVLPRPDYHYDLPAMAAAVNGQTRIVWLCSPNNPTGFVLPRAAVDDFLGRLPGHVMVIIDEAYADYVSDGDCVDSLRYVHEGRNVIAVRSFSKSRGLANLRVGYGIARPDLIDYLSRAILPFNSGALALRAAAAGLEDDEFVSRSRKLVQRERAFLLARLSEMGMTCLPSQANFVLVVDPPIPAPVLVDALAQRGIIVRPMENFGLPNAFRLSVGLREQNEQFLSALRSIGRSQWTGHGLDAFQLG